MVVTMDESIEDSNSKSDVTCEAAGAMMVDARKLSENLLALIMYSFGVGRKPKCYHPRGQEHDYPLLRICEVSKRC